MTRDVPLIIDDVAAASMSLTPLGREVVGHAAAAVQSALREFAASKGWQLVAYDQFAKWAIAKADGESAYSLDPLLPLGHRVQPLRVSRVRHADAWRISFADERALDGVLEGSDICLVDDAVASGSTLRHVCAAFEARGAAVKRIVVCASTSPARKAVLESLSSLEWLQFLPHECRTIHLRDACPYLPFSGRPSAAHPPVATGNGPVAIRIPSVTIDMAMWGYAFTDYRVLAATLSARSEVSARFSAAVGREATVSDIPLLGRDIALPAYPRHEVTASTTLVSIC